MLEFVNVLVIQSSCKAPVAQEVDLQPGKSVV